ncbi:hypothetical protein [Aquidulcibacter sp.]|uniref:hypothetical protein n=1 Tax=Aquidulcibacter sp. TaxID=2052990 RepID=UPI0025C4675A|nr:hypothetical protein [Aquidulcibacter sp.]MCA3692367.1 hypothetical protein [Aquidulcibacter sp.]
MFAVIWLTFIRPNPKVVAQMPGGLERFRLANLTSMVALLWPVLGNLILALLGFDLPEYAYLVALGLSMISWVVVSRFSPLRSLLHDLDNAHYEAGRLQRLKDFNSRR